MLVDNRCIECPCPSVSEKLCPLVFWTILVLLDMYGSCWTTFEDIPNFCLVLNDKISRHRTDVAECSGNSIASVSASALVIGGRVFMQCIPDETTQMMHLSLQFSNFRLQFIIVFAFGV